MRVSLLDRYQFNLVVVLIKESLDFCPVYRVHEDNTLGGLTFEVFRSDNLLSGSRDEAALLLRVDIYHFMNGSGVIQLGQEGRSFRTATPEHYR